MKFKHTCLTLLASMLVCSMTSFAQEATPKLLEGAMPAYPDFARAKGIEGTVVVEALVDEKGNVFAADVVNTPDIALNAASLAAVKSWKFEPAMANGEATMKVVRIPINFNLVDPYGETFLQSHDQAIAAK